jgi:hypothetical protein
VSPSRASSKVRGYPRPLVAAVDRQSNHVVVRLRGCLTLRDIPRVRETAIKSLLDTGRVVIDLAGRPIDINTPSGRGLHLATAVADSWSAAQHPDGKQSGST